MTDPLNPTLVGRFTTEADAKVMGVSSMEIERKIYVLVTDDFKAGFEIIKIIDNIDLIPYITTTIYKNLIREFTIDLKLIDPITLYPNT